MKGDREFTGTLLGFDDFVSEYLRVLSAILAFLILKMQIWYWRT